MNKFIEENKNEWGKIKENSKELKGVISRVFSALIFGVAMLIGIWAFAEAIFEITLTLTQAILITAGLGLIYLARAWWSNKRSKGEEMQVVFLRKNSNQKNNENNK